MSDATEPDGPETLLHQAAQALLRHDPAVALVCVRRALADDPALTAIADRADLVRAALPELERLARAHALAAALRFAPEQPAAPAGLLADLADALAADAQGLAVLAAAERGDGPAAREALADLADRDDLPPRLAHHLALVYHRDALFLEERGSPDAAVCHRLAWRCWLRLLRGGDVTAPDAAALLEHLLGIHRRRVRELLACADVSAARRHWDGVLALPGLAAGDDALARLVEDAVARFREQLATEYLLATREAMRYGDVPEGWRGDYEKGLGFLRRFLSLDRENVRLLTALAEVCVEWFLDCYHNEDWEQLARQVERFTPFALQLARLVGDGTGQPAARAALSEFCKFRGFVAVGRVRKAELYREALGFNPANANARELLAGLGEVPGIDRG